MAETSRPREIVLVRHGETVGNSRIRLYGATDVELSDVGRVQMQRVGDLLHGESFGLVATSPLQRSRESAAIILDGQRPEPVVIDAFREIDFGVWEGLTLEEVAARDPALHAEWLTGNMEFQFPNGDSRSAFHARVRGAVPVLLAHGEQRMLCVLHKGIIKVILAMLLDLTPEAARAYPVDLGSVHRLHGNGSRWQAVEADATGHLGDVHHPDEPR